MSEKTGCMGPLARFTVLDLTRVRSGPTAVRQLADWGANVIKIERPDQAEQRRHGSDFQNLHRNKRGMTLNLKDAAGVALFKRMVMHADVVVENYRPDVKHRLGIDYVTLRAINPGIVYGSISGFGQDGPYANRPGYDQVAQGMGGLMSITGAPGQGPMRVGIPIADLCSGLYCALGILIALLQREETGEGQWVQSSLLQAQVAMLDFQATRWLVDGYVPQQAGNYHPTAVPMGVFPTSDGHLNLAVTGVAIYERFCTLMEREEWLTDPKFATPQARYENRHELNTMVDEIMKGKTSAEWANLFNEASVPYGPINDIAETFADPQVQHLKIAQPVEHALLGQLTLLGQPIKLSSTEFNITRASPEQGEHSMEILAEFGLSPDEIATLRAQGVV